MTTILCIIGGILAGCLTACACIAGIIIWCAAGDDVANGTKEKGE